MEDYQIRDDAQTLKRAAEIQGDKSRHSAAKKHLVSEHKALSKIVGKPAPVKSKRGK